MEMKRTSALEMLSNEIAGIGYCAHCGEDHSDARLMARVRGDHKSWPPYWRGSPHTLHKEIKRIKALSLTDACRERRYVCQLCVDEDEEEDDPRDIPQRLRALANILDRNCHGIRLACAKADCVEIGQYYCRQHGRDF